MPNGSIGRRIRLHRETNRWTQEELDTGYTVTVSQYTERIGRLSQEEQRRIYQVLDTMLKHCENKNTLRKK